MLELGCGSAANLLPLAFYRRASTFVGVDAAGSQCELARDWVATLGLQNVEILQADFAHADELLTGEFDYVVGHGVFSWIDDTNRDALLALCAKRLKPGGLLCLSYNTRPGWNVRGLIRELLLQHTASTPGLRARTEAAQLLAGRMAEAFGASDHPFSQLMVRELRFACDSHPSYVAHEYLAKVNRPYWRNEFLALVSSYGLEHVADADFNYDSGRTPDDGLDRVRALGLADGALEHALDMLLYRQLHCPILTRAPGQRKPLGDEELGQLFVASCLMPRDGSGAQPDIFVHPTGFEVEAREDPIRHALSTLRPHWPRGLRVDDLFPSVADVREDLLLLQRNGLIELRPVEPADWGIDPTPLHALEAERGGYHTTPHHTRIEPGRVRR